MVPSEQIFIRLGARRFAVPSLAIASAKWVEVIDRMGVGASQTPVPVIETQAGSIIAHVTFNGRVFAGKPGSERYAVLFDPVGEPL